MGYPRHAGGLIVHRSGAPVLSSPDPHPSPLPGPVPPPVMLVSHPLRGHSRGPCPSTQVGERLCRGWGWWWGGWGVGTGPCRAPCVTLSHSSSVFFLIDGHEVCSGNVEQPTIINPHGSTAEHSSTRRHAFLAFPSDDKYTPHSFSCRPRLPRVQDDTPPSHPVPSVPDSLS